MADGAEGLFTVAVTAGVAVTEVEVIGDNAISTAAAAPPTAELFLGFFDFLPFFFSLRFLL